ncbi:MAG: lipopolysaccharide biosynthesis protein [Candidatus Methanofastidiosia archaeon]
MKKLRLKFFNPLYENATYLIFTNVSNLGTGFLFWSICARFYSPISVGLASTLISAALLLANLSTLGFNIAFIRFLPRSRDRKDIVNSCFTSSSLVSLILSSIFILNLEILSPKLFFLRETLSFSVIFILLVLAVELSILTDGIFISQRNAKYVFFRNSFVGIMKIILSVFFIALGGMGIFLSRGLAALIILIPLILFVLPKKYFKFEPEIQLKSLKPLLLFSLSNYIANICRISPGLVLPLLITNLKSPELTAYFYIPWMVSGLLFMIPLSISSSLLAEGSHEEDLEKKADESLKFSYLLLLIIGGFLVIWGGYVLKLFGESYSLRSLNLLRILAFSSPLFTYNVIYATCKNVRGEMGKVISINGITAFGTLGLSLILLKIGLEGIGFAWLLMQTVLAIGIFFYKRYESLNGYST